MKGGKEANHSNRFLMSLVTEALERHGCADAVGLVNKNIEKINFKEN